MARQDGVALRLDGVVVVMLDQQPVGALSRRRDPAHAHQHEASLQPVAIEGELQLARGQRLLSRALALRRPVAAVPQHHGSAAILSLWYGALEIPVIERVILHPTAKPLVMRIERRPRVTAPGLKTPSTSSRRS